MKIRHLVLSVLLTALFGCGGSQIEKGNTAQQQGPRISGQQSPGNQPYTKTVLQHNRSEIKGEIIRINERTDSSFSVVLKVLEITENTSYPSVAVIDNVYEVYPGYIIDEEKKITDTHRNKSLLSLKNKKKGDIISGVIFLGSDNKWIIKDLSE